MMTFLKQFNVYDTLLYSRHDVVVCLVYKLELVRCVENINDISAISMYQYCICTLDNGSVFRYVDIVSVISEISVIFPYFIILF